MKFLPKQWVYTAGSDITGHPRLGAEVVHIPTNTTIYIDAPGTEKTRTIMRAVLVAIHTALATFSTHNRISIFTYSLSSLQAIRHYHTNPGTASAKHYHHHRLVLDNITDLLETRRFSGLRITLHKIREHTNIRGNDLADAAAKLAVTHYDTLPPPHTRRVETRETAPRPNFWVMYSVKPRPPLPALATGTHCATLRRPCGLSRKRNTSKCTRARAPPHNSGSRSVMRYSVAYTTPLSIGVSSSPAKRKGPARKPWARRFTRISPIAHGREPPSLSSYTDTFITANQR